MGSHPGKPNAELTMPEHEQEQGNGQSAADLIDDTIQGHADDTDNHNGHADSSDTFGIKPCSQ